VIEMASCEPTNVFQHSKVSVLHLNFEKKTHGLNQLHQDLDPEFRRCTDAMGDGVDIANRILRSFQERGDTRRAEILQRSLSVSATSAAIGSSPRDSAQSVMAATPPSGGTRAPNTETEDKKDQPQRRGRGRPATDSNTSPSVSENISIVFGLTL